MKDFFISYTKVDREKAFWIRQILQEANPDVEIFIDESEIGAGFNIVRRIDDALSIYRHTIAIVSQDYLDSEFAEAEWTVIVMQDPAGRRGKLIPIKVGKCKPPGFFSVRHMIDITGVPPDDARALILRKLRAIDTLTSADSTEEKPEQRRAKGSPAARRYKTNKNRLAKGDRDPQIKLLKSEVLSHLNSLPQRPLICVAHGHERECHAEFFERTKEETIPEVLRDFQDEQQDPFCCLWEVWPRWKECQGKDQAAKTLEADVRAASSFDGSLYEQIVNSRARAVIITLIIKTEDAAHMSRVDSVVDYFIGIDDLPPQMLLIVNLSFRYRPPKKVGGDEAIEIYNSELRVKVDELEKRANPRASFARLGELSAISERDARDMVRQYQDFYAWDQTDIEDIYFQTHLHAEPGKIHMFDLIDELLKRDGTSYEFLL